MEDIKPKHPSRFKLKLERRELLHQLSPETAINVLLYHEAARYEKWKTARISRTEAAALVNS